MSQHPSDCEIWGSLQAGESEWEAEEPTRAGPMATAGTQGQQAEKPCCPASAPRWENSDSLLSSWQGTPAGTGSSLEPISVPAPHAHWPCRGPRGTWIPHRGGGSHQQPGHQEHDRDPSWGTQCNHQQKGSTFHQHYNGPHRHV